MSDTRRRALPKPARSGRRMTLRGLVARLRDLRCTCSALERQTIYAAELLEQVRRLTPRQLQHVRALCKIPAAESVRGWVERGTAST